MILISKKGMFGWLIMLSDKGNILPLNDGLQIAKNLPTLAGLEMRTISIDEFKEIYMKLKYMPMLHKESWQEVNKRNFSKKPRSNV